MNKTYMTIALTVVAIPPKVGVQRSITTIGPMITRQPNGRKAKSV